VTQAVLFDVDGTLIDTVDFHAESWVRAFRHFGIETRFDEVRHQIGKGSDLLMPVFVPEDVLEKQGKAMEAFRADLFLREYVPRIRPFPGVRALFERCRAAGLKVVLASSGKEDEVERYKKIAGIADLIEDQTSSSEVERSKPYPDIFQAALAKCSPVTAEQAIAVGDTPYDVEASGRAGIRCIGVLCGGFREAELREAGAVAIYRDPADLLARFDTSPLNSGPA
jgi:HAD superfamily hydrolase (TIGR01509 family)